MSPKHYNQPPNSVSSKEELEALLLEGLKSPMRELTKKDWEEIEREALEGLADKDIRP